MTANDSKSYLGYLLNKLVDQLNNTYHHSINKKLIIADYSAFFENNETNVKGPQFKVTDRVRITKFKNVFSKGYTENCSREIFIIDSVLKTNLWTYKIKDLNGKKIIEVFMKRNSCWVNYKLVTIQNQIAILEIKLKNILLPWSWSW